MLPEEIGAASAGISDGHEWGRGVILVSSEWRPRMLLNIVQCTVSIIKEYQAPNVSNAKVKKSCGELDEVIARVCAIQVGQKSKQGVMEAV